MKLHFLLCIVFLLGAPLSATADQTWVEIDGVTYGAKPDERGPLGGGAGYTEIVTSGDVTVRTADDLVAALAAAEEGQVIFIPGDVEMDLTALIYVEDLILEIPGGITLASDRGHNGSEGALITSDALDTPIIMDVQGPDVRITGIRLRGPNAKQYLDHHYRAFSGGRDHEPDGLGAPERRAHRYYYKFPVSNGIRTSHPRLRVDNCDLSAFGQAAVSLRNGEGHQIHHNFIHHCQYHGLGYGVSHNTASSVIEYNLFDANRHSIAGTGRSGSGYLARHNVELGVASSHCFDMHGGRDRRDGTDVAGSFIEIHNNTFRANQTPVVIRGVPEEECIVTRNWFPVHESASEVVRSDGRTEVVENAYGDPAEVK